MKIGYDAKRLFLNSTGLGNYSRWLVKNMAQNYPANEYFLYSPKVRVNNRLNFLNHFNNLKTITPKGVLVTSWWRTRGILNNLLNDGIEVYHGLSHELPLGIKASGIKSVVTVHDLIFMHFPQSFGWINRHIYRAKVKYACEAADKIIAISQKTKDDLIRYLNVDRAKIEVIYQGTDPIFETIQDAEQKKAVIAKYGLPAKFLLNVGTIEERKNLLLITKALARLDNDIPLVVVGKPTGYLDTVKSYIASGNLTDRVIFLHNVEFPDLPAIYQLSSVFIYPSRYEGFGLPVIEAVMSGIPVIAAKGSCLEEAGGPASLYIDPDDDGDLAKKINDVLADEKLRQKMISDSLQYSAKFEPAKLTGQLMQVYKTI